MTQKSNISLATLMDGALDNPLKSAIYGGIAVFVMALLGTILLYGKIAFFLCVPVAIFGVQLFRKALPNMKRTLEIPVMQTNPGPMASLAITGQFLAMMVTMIAMMAVVFSPVAGLILGTLNALYFAFISTVVYTLALKAFTADLVQVFADASEWREGVRKQAEADSEDAAEADAETVETAEADEETDVASAGALL